MKYDALLALKNWIPIKLLDEPNNDFCRWLYIGNKNFTEPFFDETISVCRSLPENGHLKRSVSSIDILPEWANNIDAIKPTAFIFHVSRCGSTLIAQLLGMQPQNIVLSEVPFFDDLLRYGFKTKTMKNVLLQLEAAITFYGAKRSDDYENLFIKSDSWHVHFYEALRVLYPTVPIFLLYRRPDEVLRSQQNKRGMQAIPNLLEAYIFGFDKDIISHKPLDEYMAMVLKTYFEKFVDIVQKDANAYAVNYNEGAIEIVEKIANITGIKFTDVQIAAMKDRASFHGKFPEQVFSEPKLEDAIPAYLEKSFVLYQQMEMIRNSK
jgi:hypothetical protein